MACSLDGDDDDDAGAALNLDVTRTGRIGGYSCRDDELPECDDRWWGILMVSLLLGQKE